VGGIMVTKAEARKGTIRAESAKSRPTRQARGTDSLVVVLDELFQVDDVGVGTHPGADPNLVLPQDAKQIKHDIVTHPMPIKLHPRP
jgi:hypothetical protein